MCSGDPRPSARNLPTQVQKLPSMSFRRRIFALLSAAACTVSAAPYGPDFNVADFGAKGSGIQSDTAAIQQAIDACSTNGGGRVIVPSGMKLTIATLVLKSGVDLHLERGSVL